MESYRNEALTFTAQDLVEENPPCFYSDNKKLVYNLATSFGGKYEGKICYSRWSEMPLPTELELAEWGDSLEIRPDFFGYEVPDTPGRVDWYLNFADHNLFCAYGTSLLAQDELQVAEHPALGSLREALLKRGKPFGTVEGGHPTPVLVRNVQRLCFLDTKPCAQRPGGLYGNAFDKALPVDVRAAVTLVEPPTFSNILAIEAPYGGEGAYDSETIRYVLATAYSGFAVARYEAQNELRGETVAVHTGFWGCGAYGGNRIVMTMLQLVAAKMAGIDLLVFHAGDLDGCRDVEEAVGIMDSTLGNTGKIPVGELVDRIEALGFRWGVSDGN
ncbi:poly(ADP-ribose) glycohydrolase [Geomonas propionica]|uniref:PARG catalytic Macro domain-containing protein n=1 Tax=Geomonas propionica TaxID=2798582 RepID=A0ABS0YP86_9BACT|nr:hypothetical protein [Geomonas propionica]MBJ6799759.1 hypothetical protein [Geomonas propionica]